ncbi:MAG: mechanosensitive ion channel domain-containing protein [Halobacteriales archaeon]
MAVHGVLPVPVPARLLVAALVLVVGSLLGYVAGKINRRLLERADVPDAVEGTAFERTMRGLGTSTVAVIARLSMWFIVGVAVLAALSVANVNIATSFWAAVTGLLPQLFVALIVLIVGVVVGDKLELVVSERLTGIKLPQVGVLPLLVKYSTVYIAGLIALSQIGVVTDALLIMLGGYVFGLVFVGGLALRDLLASVTAGVYLLLNQPYGIGDEVRIGDAEGIVQEVTVLVTRVEGEDAEYVVPNRRVFDQGVIRRR